MASIFGLVPLGRITARNFLITREIRAINKRPRPFLSASASTRTMTLNQPKKRPQEKQTTNQIFKSVAAKNRSSEAQMVLAKRRF
jgi:hypothetical protein